MNKEIVRFSDKSGALYKWPTKADDANTQLVGIGVIETREILTYVETLIYNEKAYTKVFGEMSQSVIDLLNTICSYCNNRDATITLHEFHVCTENLKDFKKFLLNSRLGKFIKDYNEEAGFDPSQSIINVKLIYPE